MTGIYRIFGSEMSPYSVKVRSYFRYKKIPHVWIPRNAETDEEYKTFAKLPIVPTVATPEGQGLQDSTPIIEALEPNFPEPGIHPAAPELPFLSTLIEEFGDEWGNKLMFHHRWYAEVDQHASAQTLARLSLPRGSQADVDERARMILARMAGRGHFVGSSAATAPLITEYYFELLDILEPHLANRKYLFGARPAFADFGLSAQLYEASVDPTCGGIIRARGSRVLDWCFRMIEPRNDGPFEEWSSLKPTLEPLLAYIGRYFLPWSQENARALEGGKESFSVDLAGKTYTQGPQKYHAKSLAALKQKYRAVADKTRLDPILAATDCARYLT
jgi:glutathione S-transferase